MDWLNGHMAALCDATITSKLCDDLYNDNLFVLILEVGLLMSIIMAFIYYKLIDHPGFQRWYHWFALLCINFFLNLCWGYAVPAYQFYGLDYGFVELLEPGWTTALFSIPFFFLGSLVIKPFSKNCRTTPF